MPDPIILPAPTNFDPDTLGDDLEIHSVWPRQPAGGSWVRGTLHGFAFVALVFPGQADDPTWEMGNGVSKLWLKQLSSGRVVFNWDRGLDVAAADAGVQMIVDFLAEGLRQVAFPE